MKKNKVRLVFAPKSKSEIAVALFQSPKTFWRYQLSAIWNHRNWTIEANANNLFVMKNHIVDELSASYYSFKQIDQSRSFNQYATLKIIYSFDYGKKTSQTPDYEHINSESAILTSKFPTS